MAILIKGQIAARPKPEVLARKQVAAIMLRRGEAKKGRLINSAVISK